MEACPHGIRTHGAFAALFCNVLQIRAPLFAAKGSLKVVETRPIPTGVHTTLKDHTLQLHIVRADFRALMTSVCKCMQFIAKFGDRKFARKVSSLEIGIVDPKDTYSLCYPRSEKKFDPYETMFPMKTHTSQRFVLGKYWWTPLEL
jgi:hypothetical protein